MRLFQRILALRLDLDGMQERMPASCRLAVINSREDTVSAEESAPMPGLTWSSPGGPYRP
jgi:hypothetical protein